jgi:hypothetical protein
MKRKKKLVVTLTAIILISMWIISFMSPEWTIRRHILEHLQHSVFGIGSGLLPDLVGYCSSPSYLPV